MLPLAWRKSNRPHHSHKIFRRFIGTLSAVLSGLIVTPLFADTTAVKILCLGDSITHAENDRASYRYFLWKKLIDAGIEFDFVGSMNTQLGSRFWGTPPQPDYRGERFDSDHEGHYAWEINHVVDGHSPHNGTGSGRLSEWMKGYDFDIALVHLGTNDIFREQSIAQIDAELRTLIATLRSDNPRVSILLAQLIPSTRYKRINRAIIELNGYIAEMAIELNSASSAVIVVDHHSGFDIAKDSYDGVHPNAAGEQKMAQRWFDAIELLLAKQAE